MDIGDYFGHVTWKIPIKDSNLTWAFGSQGELIVYQ